MDALDRVTAVKPGNVLRVGYFAAGLALGGALYLVLRSEAWGAAARVAREGYATLPPAQPVQQELPLGHRTRALVARQWNGFIDSTLGDLARELARRGV